ncbi:MAG: MlaD family protein [Planctomycetota bacterium]
MHGGRRFRLGMLALIAGGAFLSLLGFVLQGVLGNDTVSYFILFEENVKGMVVGSKANFQGVPIGMVADIRFQNGRTLVELSVDPTKAEIQDITRARLDRLLVTGQVTVELEGYGREGTALRPGTFIQPKADPIHQLTTKTLPDLVPQMTELLAQLDTLLDRGADLLNDDNRAHAAAILQNLDRVTAELPAAMDHGRQLLTRAEGAVTALERAADAASDELLPRGLEAITDARAALASLDAAAAEGRSLMASLRPPLQSALTLARGSLDELRNLMRQLRLAPDSLLFGVTRPAAPAGGER